MSPLHTLSLCALLGPAACSLPMRLAGDEVTGTGLYTEPREPKISADQTNADRPFTLLDKRVQIAAAAPWQTQRQEFTRTRGTIEWTLPGPAPHKENGGTAIVAAEFVPRETRISDFIAPVIERGTIASDTADGDDWRTLVWTSNDAAPRGVFDRHGLYHQIKVQYAVSFPLHADSAWVRALAADFNRLIRQLTIDGQTRCASFVTVAPATP